MHRQNAVSPIIGQMLMVFLVVILGAIIFSIVMGIISNPLREQKVAAFTVDVGNDGYGRVSHKMDGTYLTYLQMGGDDLNVGYNSSVTHGGTDATRVTLISPSGFHVVVDSVTMIDDPVKKGELYYIFKFRTGTPTDEDDYYLTDNPDRIFKPSWNGIEPLEPGKWEIIISYMGDTDTVLFRGEVFVQ